MILASRGGRCKSARFRLTGRSRVTFMVALVTLFAGCAQGRGRTPSPPPKPIPNTWHPQRLASVIDLTESMQSVKTEPMTAESLRPAVEAVAERGGEVRAFFVRGNATQQPIIEVTFDAAPPKPVPSAKSGDVFTDADNSVRFNVQLQAWKKADTERREQVRVRIDGFLKSIAVEVSRTALADRTDLAGTIDLVASYLQEPPRVGAATPDLVLLAISDGRENARLAVAPKLTEAVTVIVASPTGKSGIFLGLSPKPPLVFLSRSAAISHAVTLLRGVQP